MNSRVGHELAVQAALRCMDVESFMAQHRGKDTRLGQLVFEADVLWLKDIVKVATSLARQQRQEEWRSR